MKKFGIILILIGIGVPLISIAYASNYQHNAGLIPNIQKMEIVLKGEKGLAGRLGVVKGKKKVVIPYRYIFTIGVCIVLIGVSFITLSKSKKSKGE